MREGLAKKLEWSLQLEFCANWPGSDKVAGSYSIAVGRDVLKFQHLDRSSG